MDDGELLSRVHCILEQMPRRAHSLTSLNLSRNQLGDAQAVCRVLFALPQLVTLSMAANPLGKHTGELAPAIKGMAALEDLDLSELNMGTGVIQDLLPAL